MPGYNFQSYMTEFNRYRRWGAKASNPFDIAPADMTALFHEAFRLIQLKTDIAKTKTTINLAATTYEHALPSTVMGYKIDSIQVESESSTAPVTLERKTYEFMEETFDLNDSTPTGSTPLYWSPSKANQRSIIIAPASSYAKTSGIHITASIAPIQMNRIYQSSVDSYTASVTYDTTAVTISNSAPVTAGKIQNGDEFGVIRTTDWAGSTISNLTPQAWYRVTTASGTSLTLTDTFDEPTASSLNFITAQVHPIEQAYPGVLGFIPVKLALAEWLAYTDRDKAFQLKEEAMAELMTIATKDQRGTKFSTQQIGKFYPAALED